MAPFEQRLTSIIDSSDSEVEEQTKLLLVMAREMHAIKLILWWMMVIVPIAASVVVLFVTNMPHHDAITP